MPIKNLYKHILIVSLGMCFALHSYADDTDIAEQIKYKQQVLETLKKEIQQIDAEMVRCEKQKKGWVAATVIGSAGVVATGTAAAVQGVKIKEAKTSNTQPKADKQ